jgi:hypothetical protein
MKQKSKAEVPTVLAALPVELPGHFEGHKVGYCVEWPLT